MIVEMNVADVRAGVELDSACLPGTVLPWLLDRQLVFCWISRCPGELGIAVTALMARVQSALWHGGFASIISPYVYFPAQGFHGDECWTLGWVGLLKVTLLCEQVQSSASLSWAPANLHGAVGKNSPTELRASPSRTQTRQWNCSSEAFKKPLLNTYIPSLYLNSVTSVLCWKYHGHQEGSLRLVVLI